MSARQPLVDALSRAFPSWEDRHALARTAQIKDPQLTGEPAAVWSGLLDEADAQGRTAALAQAVEAAGRPKLAVAVRQGGMAPERPRAVVLGAALMAAALFLFLFYVALDPGQSRVGDPGAATASQALRAPASSDHEHADWKQGEVLDHVRAERPTRETQEEPGSEDTPPPASTGEDPLDEAETAAPEPAPPVAAEPVAAPAPPAPARAAAAPAVGTTGWGKCQAAPGERIGYAWAGESSPTDPWHITDPVNVRMDYPRADNNWNTKSATVCILPAGIDLPLPEGTLAIAGGAVYVPVIAPVAR